MQINIWYPAKPTNAARLKYGHYVDLMGRQTDFAQINDERRAFINAQFVKKTNALGGNGTFTAAKLDTLRSLETHTYADIPRLDGSFPLVIFPGGGSPAFQSIMCEFLASHGFIVATFAVKGQAAFTDEASTAGHETAADDIAFVVAK